MLTHATSLRSASVCETEECYKSNEVYYGTHHSKIQGIRHPRQGARLRNLRLCRRRPVRCAGSRRSPLPAHAAGAGAYRPCHRAARRPRVALVYARSGLSIKHGLCMANGVGVVDSDYRGELKVPMVNLGAEAYTIQPGERWPSSASRRCTRRHSCRPTHWMRPPAARAASARRGNKPLSLLRSQLP